MPAVESSVIRSIEYDALIGAASKGVFFNERIKDRYSFTPVAAQRDRGR